MASITLTEAAKLATDDFKSGIIESVVTTDNFYEILPFMGIEGNSLRYTRENAPAPVAAVAVGENIGPGAVAGNNQAERQAAMDSATFTEVHVNLTTILGTTEMNGLIQAGQSGDNDQTAAQIESKVKSAGRKYRDMLINGVGGVTNEFPGLLSLVPAGQKVATAANGSNLSFGIIDELVDKVKDKDGQVDYLMMHSRTLRSFKALLRSLGGASILDVLKLPSGKQVMVYNGTPIFTNDNIPTDQAQGASGNICTTIFAGTLDDGSSSMGIAGATTKVDAGLAIHKVGRTREKDEEAYQVVWYCGLALFSELGIASVSGILD